MTEILVLFVLALAFLVLMVQCLLYQSVKTQGDELAALRAHVSKLLAAHEAREKELLDFIRSQAN